MNPVNTNVQKARPMNIPLEKNPSGQETPKVTAEQQMSMLRTQQLDPQKEAQINTGYMGFGPKKKVGAPVFPTQPGVQELDAIANRSRTVNPQRRAQPSQVVSMNEMFAQQAKEELATRGDLNVGVRDHQVPLAHRIATGEVDPQLIPQHLPVAPVVAPQSRNIRPEVRELQMDRDPAPVVPGQTFAAQINGDVIRAEVLKEVSTEQAVQRVAQPQYTSGPQAQVQGDPTLRAKGESVDLPSQFLYYPFQDLYVQKLKALHLSKLYKASKANSFKSLVEVISTVVSTSDLQWNTTELINELTIPDFYWILYYLRLESYSKAQFMFTTFCENEAHIQKVQNKELAPETLRIVQMISKSDLKETKLEEAVRIPPEQMNGLWIRPATVRDLIAITEDPRLQTDEEFQWEAQLACYVEGPTLDARIEQIRELSIGQIEVLREYDRLCTGYGIEESTIVHCKECRASHRAIISIDAHTFLDFSTGEKD